MVIQKKMRAVLEKLLIKFVWPNSPCKKIISVLLVMWKFSRNSMIQPTQEEE